MISCNEFIVANNQPGGTVPGFLADFWRCHSAVKCRSLKHQPSSRSPPPRYLDCRLPQTPRTPVQGLIPAVAGAPASSHLSLCSTENAIGHVGAAGAVLMTFYYVFGVFTLLDPPDCTRQMRLGLVSGRSVVDPLGTASATSKGCPSMHSLIPNPNHAPIFSSSQCPSLSLLSLKSLSFV